MRTHRWSRIASLIVGAEGIGLVVLVLWQITALIAGDTESLESALALAVMTAVGAAAVLAFAIGTWRGLSWGRSGSIVTQLLILAVAGGAATGAYAHPLTALGLALPAVVALALLILGVRAAGRAERAALESAGPDAEGEPG